MRERDSERKEIEKGGGRQKESDRDIIRKISPLRGSQQCSIDRLQLVFLVVKVSPESTEYDGLMYTQAG